MPSAKPPLPSKSPFNKLARKLATQEPSDCFLFPYSPQLRYNTGNVGTYHGHTESFTGAFPPRFFAVEARTLARTFPRRDTLFLRLVCGQSPLSEGRSRFRSRLRQRNVRVQNIPPATLPLVVGLRAVAPWIKFSPTGTALVFSPLLCRSSSWASLI